jgi:signal recognition particle GTPase
MTKDKLKNIIAKKHADRVAKKEVKASREVIAKQSNVLSQRLAKKLDMRMEKILFDAEELVKKYFPARYVSASLTKLQKQLISEGVSCTFDKSVTKEAIKKTAKSDITSDECDEAIKKIAETVVAETEDTLEACDKAIKNLAKKHFPHNRISTAHVMRKHVESKMKNTGLNFKF